MTDAIKLYVPDEAMSLFTPGYIFQVLSVNRGEYTIMVKRVYTEANPVENEPPPLGVSVAEKVGTREKLGG